MKKFTHNIICVTGMYLMEIIDMILVGQVSGLVENLNSWIFSDIINMINVKLCSYLTNIKLTLCRLLSKSSG